MLKVPDELFPGAGLHRDQYYQIFAKTNKTDFKLNCTFMFRR